MKRELLPVPPAESFAGRSLHRWLVGIPVLFFVATFVCFALYASEGDGRWLRYAFQANVLGIATAVLAGAVGALDYQRVPLAHPAQKPARAHGVLNTAVLLVLACNVFGHWDAARAATTGRMGSDYAFDPRMALVLSGAAVLLTLISGSIGAYVAHGLRVGEVSRVAKSARGEGRLPMPPNVLP